MIKRVVQPRTLRGEVEAPGDKSITHRAFIFNAMAVGRAHVRNFCRGEDCLSTLRCLHALGAETVEEVPEPGLRCQGRGDTGFVSSTSPLDAGNSGTTMRLLSGLLAGQPFRTTITGDDSLRSRPMGRLIEPLRLMGADIRGSNGDSLAPLVIRGGRLRGISYRMPVASAQVKSAILIAGLYAEGETVVEEPAPSRDHTERMLTAMGAAIRVEEGRVSIAPGPLTAIDVAVPGDLSAAAYWLVAGALHPDAEVVVRGVGVNPSRTGILDVLREMGADIAMENRRSAGGEPVADIRVRSGRLKGVSLGGALIPRVIDELPLVALAGALAEGVTEIRDASELRVKESDRIAATAAELSRLGVRVRELPDGMTVEGGARLRGATCSSYGDHRLAMTLAVAGLLAQGETVVQGAEAVRISYPDFWGHLARLAGQG